MRKSTLSQVLDAFDNRHGPLTMSQIARRLDVSPAHLEGMIQYWVRKGKLREIFAYTDCGTCGRGVDNCPFVIELPRTYERVTGDSETIPLSPVGSSCACQT